MTHCFRPILATLVLALTFASPVRAASDFPSRPVRIEVGFVAGGTTDLLARIIADGLQSLWNSPVVVENRPGADGIIATNAVHQAEPDGYTLLMSTNALVITPHMKPLPYDPINDFEPITIVGREYHHMMVTNALPVKTVKEFIDLAKSTPGGLTFSSAGPGSAPYLGMEGFRQAAGIPSMVHVPYPGSLPAVMALVSGDVQSMFSSPSTTLQFVHDGKVRLLAVAGPTRDPNAPEAPTLAESGLPGFESNTWFALMAPAHVPPEILEKIRSDAIAVMHTPEVIKRIKDINSTPVGDSSEDFRQIIKSDLEAFGRVIANAK
jgi:tripartite-type tricarboxylate transporter receptor subunit TctC